MIGIKPTSVYGFVENVFDAESRKLVISNASLTSNLRDIQLELK